MVAAGFLLYVIAHAALYLGWLRWTHTLGTENGIFLYHVLPFGFGLVACIGLVVLMPEHMTPAHVVLLMALHTIYSLSFLELWALTDGGFSFTILEIYDAKVADQDTIRLELIALGTTKQQSRLAALVGSGLIERSGDGYRLTPAGRWSSRLFALICGLANIRPED